MTIQLAIIGRGKIATDQHLPAIARQSRFHVPALVDPQLPDDPRAEPATFSDIDGLIASRLTVDAVSLAVPPQVRYALAVQAIERGWHVLLEKPPGITLGEVVALETRAREAGVVLYASWHSRHAPAIEAAREHLVNCRVSSVRIDWREDVTVFHPGQAWIWQAGGLGVFDPGINALSIVTRILPHALRLQSATLDVPENCETPIAARLSFIDTAGAPIDSTLDFRHRDEPAWDIHIATDDGVLALSQGGATLAINGHTTLAEDKAEYDGVYAHYAALIDDGRADVDLAPFRHVADAFLIGTRRIVAPFHE